MILKKLSRPLIISFVVALVGSACAGGDVTIGVAARGVDSSDGDGSAVPPISVVLSTDEASEPAAGDSPAEGAEPEVSGPVRAGVALVGPAGADLAEVPGGGATITAASGLLFGFTERRNGWLRVLTTCNTEAWVPASAVEVTAQADGTEPGLGFDLSNATVVLDPGHGARDWGGVGPTGLNEKHVNLDIAARVRDLMQRTNNVDWLTGEVTPGTEVPSFGAVLLTRAPEGPEAGDYELGLAYRAHIANQAGADALVSIHNNTVAHRALDEPGTEIFYSVGTEGSDRLAALLYEELILSFAAFQADWSGGNAPGVRARVDPETDTDYYGLLRRAEMPAAIVEGVYISSEPEEALLKTDAFLQAYAEGVYRGVVRFLTTDDPGAEINEPELFPDDAGVANTNKCVIPEHA